MIGSPLVIAEKSRARLQALLAGGPAAFTNDSVAELAPLPNPCDLVITACEVNALHGTGTLLQRIFADSHDIVSLRTHNFYDGDQTFGAARFSLPLAQSARAEISTWLRWTIANTRVRNILCLPYTPAEPNLAMAARDVLGVPLCTYIMDDKNVCADGISDDAMYELLRASRLRLVISPEMREAYEAKYGLPFWVMPPVVADSIVRRTPAPMPTTRPLRGVLLGNMWGQRWLDMLRSIFRGSDVEIDWYCNQWDPPGLDYDRAELAADGIHQQRPIAEEDLPSVLGAYPFAIVPTDTFDGKSLPAIRAIAELSLPSRMVTMMATANLPMIVVGDRGTCAARFVERFDLGTVVPYDPAAVHAAIADLTTPAAQTRIRARSAALAPAFSAAGSDAWIWRSLDMGEPATDVYEALMPRPETAPGS